MEISSTTPEKFAVLLVTFRDDFRQAKRLTETFLRFNTEQISMHVLVPDEDEELFSSLRSENVNIIPYSYVPVRLATEPVCGIRPGYVNQGILKLSFHRLNLASNYLCVDSDSEFIRGFAVSSFFSADGRPLQVLYEDKDLHCDLSYLARHGDARVGHLQSIWSTLGGVGPFPASSHGFSVFRTIVLQEMESSLFREGNRDFLDLVQFSGGGFEFSWYNFFLTLHYDDYVQVEPFFKTFHSYEEFLSFRIFGFRNFDWSKRYVGVVINSNFQRNRGGKAPMTLSDMDVLSSARYLHFRQLHSMAMGSLLSLLLRPIIVFGRVLLLIGRSSLPSKVVGN